MPRRDAKISECDDKVAAKITQGLLSSSSYCIREENAFMARTTKEEKKELTLWISDYKEPLQQSQRRWQCCKLLQTELLKSIV